MRKPRKADGARVWNLIKSIEKLDDNSMYCNLLQCSHFAGTCALAELVGAEMDGELDGLALGLCDGDTLGLSLGDCDGDMLGLALGEEDGAAVGDADGDMVGAMVGDSDGASVFTHTLMEE